MKSRSIWFLLMALIGATATLFVVVNWSPDNLVQTPPDVVRIKAATDAQRLGLQVSGEPVIRISAGPRHYSSSSDLKVLLQEAEAQARGQLLAAAPPLRLSARFINATGSMSERGELLLEYNTGGELIAASFGIDNKVPEWLRGPVNSVFSDQLAESLVGPDPPHFDSMPISLASQLATAVLGSEPGAPERVPAESAEELLFHTAADQPGAYVFWDHDGSWMALRQPVPYAAVSYRQSVTDSLLGKAVSFLTTAAWLISLLLAWRAYRRNKTVGYIWICVALLIVGFLPMLRHLQIGPQLIVQLAPYILAHLCVLLLWFLGESILREQDHEVIEHWDRLIQRSCLASTGRSILLGVASGAWLALLLAGGGCALTFANPRLIAELQGGYDRLLIILPDYFSLPSPLSQGLALAAATSALVAVLRRLWGNTGMMLAVVLSSLLWAQASPTSPEIWAYAIGLVAAVTAAWLLLRHGLLALLVAAITAVSLPSAGVAWLNFPNLIPSALLASSPLLLLCLGLLISLRAPEERAEEGYLSKLKTLLLCDLVESTSLVRTLGDSKAAEIFGRHDKIARDLLREFDGREIDKTDGFLLLFDRPINAVKYALAYHRALSELSAATEVRLESRVGIHFGEVFLRRNPSEAVARGAKPIEVEGLAKPVAARLMSLAQGRQTLLTRAVYDLARRSAVSEMDASQDLTWKEHGKYHAKGVDEPIEVYEVGVADFAPLSAPMSSDKAWRIGEQPVTASKITEGTDPLRTTAIPVMAQGMNIGHYRVLDRLGRGGMGEVYAAEDSRLNRRVAIKALPVELASDPESLQRFEREAQAVAALDHPNIVTIYSVDEHSGRSYLIMELIEGRSLSDMIDPRGMPLGEFFELAIPFADAIGAAHESGITHRDLKPTNVMIGINGRLKVLDFGLAKFNQPQEEDESQEQLTSTGRVLGTMPYMSPEQVRGKPVDHRTDIFSIGIIFFELLTGKRPFSGETQADLISTIVRDAPAELADIRSKIPRQLRRIIRRCLEKEPDDRYQSANELRQALEEAMAELKPGLDKSTRSFPVRQVLSGAAIAVLVCAGGYMLWKYRDLLAAPPPPTTGEVVTAVDQPVGEAAAAELLRSGQLAEALDAYQGLLAETPDSPQLRRGLARAQIAAGDYSATVALLSPSPKSPPLALSDLILLAEAYHLLGDHESELDLARQALAAEPESQDAIHIMSVAQAAAGRAEEATEGFYALLAGNGTDPYLVDIANELQVHGHQAAACRLYQQLDDWYHGLSRQELSATPGTLQAAIVSRLMLGDLDGAGSYLDQVRELPSADQIGLGFTPAELTSLTAQLAALRGDRSEADRLRQELVSTDLQGEPGGNLAPQIPVAIALGDVELAVELLRGAVALGLAQDRSLHADPVLSQLEEPLADLLANQETAPEASQGEQE